jgi:hypothetical protein
MKMKVERHRRKFKNSKAAEQAIQAEKDRLKNYKYLHDWTLVNYKIEEL